MDTINVAYGEYISVPYHGEKTLPLEYREILNDRAEAVSRALGYPITSRDFLWAEGKASPGDPLGQQATAGLRYYLAMPRDLVEAQRDARIRDQGWVPFSEFVMPPPTGDPRAHERFELADFSFNGVPVRYARIRPEA